MLFLPQPPTHTPLPNAGVRGVAIAYMPLSNNVLIYSLHKLQQMAFSAMWRVIDCSGVNTSP